MRRLTCLTGLFVLAILTASVFAQLGNIRDSMRNQVDNAVDEHNKQMEDALTGDDMNKPQQPAPAGRDQGRLADPQIEGWQGCAAVFRISGEPQQREAGGGAIGDAGVVGSE